MGINRQLISLPTGSGETIIMSAVAKHFNRKTLILAHREELLNQAADKMRLFWPEVEIGICKSLRNEIDKQVVIGSIQSCARQWRTDQLKEQGFGLVMVDEAHHAVSDSYQRVINELGLSAGSPGLLIGVTATPQRADNYGLGAVFDKMVFSRSIGTMIKAGYLSSVSGRRILTNTHLGKIRSQNGDFAVSELSNAVNTMERNQFIADRFVQYAGDRKAVVFCADVQHCHEMAEAFNERGIVCASIWGAMGYEKREQTLKELKAGKLQAVTSCGVLTEGFDEPSIDAVVMARPTKSLGLYIQCVGRGLRLWPGKENCLVLDFTDQGYSIDKVATLHSAIPESIHFPGSGYSEAPQRTTHFEIIEESDKEFDILGTVHFSWVALEGNEWSLLDDAGEEIVISPKDYGFVSTLYSTDGSVIPLVKTPLPLDYCSGVCEDYARVHLKTTFADMSADWMKNPIPPSRNQVDYLISQKAYREGMTKAQASFEIRKIIAAKNRKRRNRVEEPATAKQVAYLKRLGGNPDNMSKDEASIEIARLVKEKQGAHV